MKQISIFIFILFSIIVLVESAPKIEQNQRQHCKALCDDIRGIYDFQSHLPLCICEISRKLSGEEFIQIQNKANEWRQMPFQLKQANFRKRDAEDNLMEDLVPVFEQPLMEPEPTTETNKFKQRLSEIKEHFNLPSAESSSDKLGKFKSKLDKLKDDLVASPKLLTKSPLMSLRFNKPGFLGVTESVVGEMEPTSKEDNTHHLDLQEATNNKLTELKSKLDKLRDDFVVPHFYKGTPTQTDSVVGNMKSKSEENNISEQETTTSKLADFKSKLDKLRDDLITHTLSPKLSLRFNKGGVTESIVGESIDKLDEFKLKLGQLKSDLADTPKLINISALSHFTKVPVDDTTESIVGAINPNLFNPSMQHNKFGLPSAPLLPLTNSRAVLDPLHPISHHGLTSGHLLPFSNSRAAIDPLHPISHHGAPLLPFSHSLAAIDPLNPTNQHGLHGLRSRINKLIDGIDHGIQQNPTLRALDTHDINKAINQVKPNNLNVRMDATTPSMFWGRFFGLQRPGHFGHLLGSSGPNATNESDHESSNENNEETTTQFVKVVQPKNLIQSSEEDEIITQTPPSTVSVHTREVLQSELVQDSAIIVQPEQFEEFEDDFKLGITPPGLNIPTKTTTPTSLLKNEKNHVGTTVIVPPQKSKNQLTVTSSSTIASTVGSTQFKNEHKDVIVQPKELQESEPVGNIKKDITTTPYSTTVKESDHFNNFDMHFHGAHSGVKIMQPKEFGERKQFKSVRTHEPKELHEFNHLLEDEKVGAALPGVIVQPAYLNESDDEDDLLINNILSVTTQSSIPKKIFELHEDINKNIFNSGPTKFIAKIPKKEMHDFTATTTTIKELDDIASDSLMMENFEDN